MALPDADGEADNSKRQASTKNVDVLSISKQAANDDGRVPIQLKQLDETTPHPKHKNPSGRDGDKLEVARPKYRVIAERDTDELMGIIRDVFSATEPLDQQQVFVEVARALGFKRTGRRIREEIQSVLRTAVKRHIVYHEKGIYGIDRRNIEQYSREELIQTLLAALGLTWWDRSDAIRTAARRLGFRRTGRRISDSFKSVINGAIRRGLLESEAKLIRRVR